MTSEEMHPWYGPYQPPAFLVDRADLVFQLDFARTRVTAKLFVHRNPELTDTTPLVLNGRNLTLRRLAIDGHTLGIEDYDYNGERLLIPDPPQRFTLESEVWIHPEENQDLMGLYRSDVALCTQCEPDSFQRITFFPDRPDVLARFRVRLEGDRDRFPVLLSNGNPVDSGQLPDNGHYVTWQDPLPKPCYLFALVAGRLNNISDSFRTASGIDTRLRLWVEEGEARRGQFALDSLKRAMRHDETHYGREYYLEELNLVAVRRYTMGAMENTGLNIYSDRRLLADPSIATDSDYRSIESLVAHEYFHHWSGNRVTIRDWMQVALKEGLTVYREQDFATERDPLRRLRDIQALRTGQFREDAGPLSHPPRPSGWRELENIFTDTVYLKGAELFRLLERWVGKEIFLEGCRHYFARNDGHAVTIEDFLACLSESSGHDLSRMLDWFEVAGTPELILSDEYDEAGRTWTLTVSRGDVPDSKQALPTPLALELLDSQGQRMKLRIQDVAVVIDSTGHCLHWSGNKESFTFIDIPEQPTPALFQAMSAPVRFDYPWSEDELARLACHGDDHFVRRDAIVRLSLRAVASREVENDTAADTLIAIFSDLLGSTSRESTPKDLELTAHLMDLPGFSELALEMQPTEVDQLREHHSALQQRIARCLQPGLHEAWQRFRNTGQPEPSPSAIAKRALANRCLDYLSCTDEGSECARIQYRESDNLTDCLAALQILLDDENENADTLLQTWEEKYGDEDFLMDRWFALQAASSRLATPERMQALTRHPGFSDHLPHRVRSLADSFCMDNPARFHALDGSGYAFVAERIRLLDRINPPLAAELARRFSDWATFANPWRDLMKNHLDGLKGENSLSALTSEVIKRSLKSAVDPGV